MRLTDAESDVMLEFTEGQYFRWPQELVDLIHTYGFDERIDTVTLPSGKRTKRYKISITDSRWRDEVGPAVERMRKAQTEQLKTGEEWTKHGQTNPDGPVPGSTS